MITTTRKITPLVLALVATVATATAQTPDELAKMEAAMPKKATVAPKQPRRVLVFSQALGFHHDSIPYGEKAFQMMGEKTGAFTAGVTQDPAALSPENLAKYDAIIFNNSTGETITTPTVQQGLLDFVKVGKGVVGIHAATDSNYHWAEYGDMMGGYFDAHPWRSKDTVTLKIDEPDHPVAKAFDGKSFPIQDEIYQFKDPYSRQHDLVLTSLDTDKTDMKKQNIHRTDGDFGVSWVRSYGKGRVFYCSLGHNSHIYWNPTVLQHYLDGIQFAIGDLEAPSTPKGAGAGADEEDTTATANNKPAIEDNKKGLAALSGMATTASLQTSTDLSLDQAVEALKGYDYGKDRAFLIKIDDAIRDSNGKPEELAKLADSMVAIANDDNLAYAARDLALRKIELIGGDAQAEKIAPLLTNSDEKLAEMARIAIGIVPGKAADKALLDALGKTKGKLQEGIITSLGRRAVNEAVEPLAAIAGGSDENASRALLALGDIASPEAANALLKLTPSDAYKADWLNALNDAAATLTAAGKEKDLAAQLYDKVLDAGKDSPARLAAYKGKAVLSGKPEAMALETLDGNDPMLSQIARELLVRGTDEGITPQLLDLLKSAPAEKKIVIVEILGARKDKAALDTIAGLAADGGKGEELQVAAIRALQTLGDQKVIAMLVKVAAETKGDVKSAAETTLKEMPVPEVDPELVNLLGTLTDPKQKVVVIETIAARKSPDAVDPLLQAAQSDDAAVATAAFKALPDLASEKNFDALLKSFVAAKDRAVREGARAVGSIAGKVKPRTEAISKLKTAMDSASNDIKVAILGIIGNLGTPEALQILNANVAAGSDDIKDAAVRALAAFPDPSALDDLLKIAAESKSEVHRVLAVRGVARLLTEPSGKSTAERLEMLKKAMDIAKADDEKKAVVGAAADMKMPGVLEVLIPLLHNPALKDEVSVAILKQAPIAYQIDPAKASEQLNPLRDKLDKANWDKLEKALQPSEANGGVIRAWQVSKVFKEKDAIKKELPPEKKGEAKYNEIVWGGTDESEDRTGQVELDKYFSDNKGVAIFMRAFVWSPEERDAVLETASDDGLRAWFNDKKIVEDVRNRSFLWWQDKSQVHLKRGWNTVVLKVGNAGGGWQAAARIVDDKGKPFGDLKFSATPQQN